MPSILILKPGLLTTIQDAGRPGLGRFGVPYSGAMDPLAFRLANRLVGNSERLPVLEITAVGPELEFQQDTYFALAGGNLSPTLEGRALDTWQSHVARGGEAMRFGVRRQGARCYLAVAGGFQIAPVLGSAATDLDSGFGGRDGKPLRSKQILEIGEQKGRQKARVRWDFFGQYSDPFDIRFVREEEPLFEEEALARFKAGWYRVSKRSNRMGYRLHGPAVASNVAGDLISEAIPPGTIQIPVGGEPILLMVDRPSVGGYPRIGYVIRADLPKAGQLWVGHTIRFREIKRNEAHCLVAEQEAMLKRAVVFE
jgi:antagonist of KipI